MRSLQESRRCNENGARTIEKEGIEVVKENLMAILDQ